jgi:hypothetical protein
MHCQLPYDRRVTLWGFVPLAILVAYGVAFASVALGFSLIAFDDHPGQLYRLWHVVGHGWAPWTWNPGWWAGYPELQFYPPALAYAGALIHVGSWGTVSLAGAYQALVWLAYFAPMLTVWLLLRRVLADGWLAVPGAFVALTLSAGLASGVEGGVHIGMVSARLGWAALPLVPLMLAGWMSGARGFPWGISVLIAGILLTHPAHLPAAVVLVLLAAWWAAACFRSLKGSARRPSAAHLALPGVAFAYAVGVLALAAGLTAFWTVPLLARLDHTRALAWGSLSVRDLIAHPLVLVLGVLAALGTRGRLRAGKSDTLAGLLTIFPWAMVVVVVVDALGLEVMGLRWLPADRVADSAWLAFVLAGGAMAGRLIARAAGGRPRARATLSLAAVAVVGLLGLPGQTLTLWPRASDWPRYETIERGMRLDALWSTIRAAPAGRLLFVRSGVPLVYGTEWWRPHSHVTAMAPLAAGRDIVNGTFTHPSPVAAHLYRGDAGPGAIRELVERLDGRRLFGRALEELDAGTLNGYADRLGISVVVALDEDLPRLASLRDNPVFSRVIASAPFVIYARRAPLTLPSEIAPGHLRMTAEASDTWHSTHIAYYPLWRVTSEGHPVSTRRGALGDLEVRVPRAGATIDLVYRRGAVETAGAAISVASLIALALVWGAAHLRSAQPTPTPTPARKREKATVGESCG